MDRYVIKEPRSTNAGYSPGPQQIVAFAQNALNGQPQEIMAEPVYYGARYGSKYPQPLQVGSVNGPRFMSIIHATSPYINNAPSPVNVLPSAGQTHMISGIDPAYLNSYASGNAAYIVNGTSESQSQLRNEMNHFGAAYQNRNFAGPTRNNIQLYNPAHVDDGKEVMFLGGITEPTPVFAPKKIGDQNIIENNNAKVQPKLEKELKIGSQSHAKTRSEKIKALHKSGPRAFSGPVEKVLKWHKALQDIGVLVIYEIVAKCVSVRQGDDCSKILVIRDDNGPAVQVVYYEIDFLLPELRPPCTVRVVGRMLAGTCRLQAFNVRLATGDDVAILPRRAAVADHHVAKLFKENDIIV